MTGSRVDVTRGGTLESSHRLSGAVADETGAVVAWFGDPDRVTFFRSSAKPFQALPLVEDGVMEAFALTDEELAVCCASHSGEPEHIELVQRLLDRGGFDAEALACGVQPPYNRDAADALVRSGGQPGRIHNNCSGKHAGMLLLALHHGWSPEGYEQPEHPVQQRMTEEVVRWSGVPRDQVRTAVDGCGVVCFGLSVAAMASAYGRFLGAAGTEGPARRVVRAMTGHPFAVAGTRRLCTDVMQASGGAVWAKVGAEGVYGAGLVERGLGVSLKAEDGGWRAGEVGLLTLLSALDGVTDELRAELEPAYQRVLDTRGDTVGTLEGTIQLTWTNRG